MTKKIIRAIKASIKHRERDILKPLQGGHKIHVTSMNKLEWENDKTVKCYDTYCPLCIVNQFFCPNCPLDKIDDNCNDYDSTWKRFRNKPNITTTKAMIRKLKSLLPKEEHDG